MDAVLVSTYRRAREPLVLACIPNLVGEGMQVDLLMVAPHAPRLAYRMKNVETGEAFATVTLPDQYLNQPSVSTAHNVTLEVIHE